MQIGYCLALGLGLSIGAVCAAGADPVERAAETRIAALMGQEKAGMNAVRRGHAERILTRASQEGATSRRFDAAWLRALPRPEPTEDLACLAQALYHEARGEGITGQYAVAEVILNRVESPSYPDTICGVVRQGAHRNTGCQFSFTCDGNSERIGEPDAYGIAKRIAGLMAEGAPRDLTDGATHFHNLSVRPRWASRLPQTAQIGAHVFYREELRLSAN